MGTRRCQERDHVGDVLRLAKIAQYDLSLGERRALVTGIETADLSCIDQPRLDAVHGDAVLSDLFGQALRSDNEAGLCDHRGIDDLGFQVTRHTDDRARLPLEEIREQRLSELAVAIEIERHALDPMRFRSIDFHRAAAARVAAIARPRPWLAPVTRAVFPRSGRVPVYLRTFKTEDGHEGDVE